MNKRLFLTRTQDDPGNFYLYAYSEEILSEAERKGWKIEKAEDQNANRSQVISRLANRPNFIVFNGHGSNSEVCGHNQEVLLNESDAHLLSGSVVFMRSCSSLNVLGKNAADSGAKAVIGYVREFWIPMVNEYRATPLKDPSAIPALETSNVVPLKILKGSSIQDAVSSSKNKAKETVLKLLVSGEPYDSPALSALVHNAACLDFKGDANAIA